MTPSDLEQGLGQSSRPRASPFDAASATSSPVSPVDNPKRKLDRDELHVFQCLVGISFLQKGGLQKPESERPPAPASAIQDIFFPSAAAKVRFRNRGLYDRAISLDMKNRVMYALTHYVISGLYILQILLTATFTALSGEVNTSRTALTVLGAISTVVAGMLAWLTGQGMPIRFRRARDQYREVVRVIERTERMFAIIDEVDWPEGERPDPVKEHIRLGKLFDEARQDQEANYPETHQNPNQNQMSQKHDELLEEFVKEREQKERVKGELEALQKELNTLKSPKIAMRSREQSTNDLAPNEDL